MKRGRKSRNGAQCENKYTVPRPEGVFFLPAPFAVKKRELSKVQFHAVYGIVRAATTRQSRTSP